MTEVARALAITLALAGCARTVELEIHHPDQCCPDGQDGCGANTRPLSNVQAFQTQLVRLGGTPQLSDCVPVPPAEELDAWDDLTGFVFIDTVFRAGRASDAIEVRIDGLSANCAEESDLVLTCNSLGDTAADLETDRLVRIWCDCPFSWEE